MLKLSKDFIKSITIFGLLNILYYIPVKGGLKMSNRCPSGTFAYTIRAGDTFFQIARRYGISLDALLRANPGVDPDRLYVGQIICVPQGSDMPDACPLLSQGSRGPFVREAQTLLRNRGFDPGPIDGIFGTRTRSAVIAFQRSQNLTPDGIIGVRTWTALGKNCSSPPPPGRCPQGTISYTIRSGDTLYLLANRYNTTVEAIMRANPGLDPYNLRIGQVICIPR